MLIGGEASAIHVTAGLELPGNLIPVTFFFFQFGATKWQQTALKNKQTNKTNQNELNQTKPNPKNDN